MSRCWMLYIMLSICSMAYGMPDTSTDSDTTHADNYGMEVSLLTCEPHDEIYSLYGHTAIRIQDKRPGAFAEDYVVNFGPQHPSTHGVMRLRTLIDGETVRRVVPVPGYIHRGIEKLCESHSYPQTLMYTDRLDYMSAHQNRHCLCLCIEKALGVEVPRRVQIIRVMMDELMRL